jgi:hypothetical protein
MTCKEVTRVLKYYITASPDLLVKVEEHAAGCASCSEMLALDRLSTSLIRNYCAPARENVEPSPFWTTRLKARIQEMKEQGVSSWEAAIMGLKGVITAMGAVAIILFAVSLQWQLTNTSDTVLRVDNEIEDAGQQQSLEELLTDASENGSIVAKTNLYE